MLHCNELFSSSFHNKLITVHLNGKVNRRVDYLIHHLLEYEKNSFFCYKSARTLPPGSHKKAKEERGHHERSLQISLKMVQVLIVQHLFEYL